MLNEVKIVERLKELGCDLEAFGYRGVERQTYDQEVDMGYLYLDQEGEPKPEFGGNVDFPQTKGVPEFVLDLGKKKGQIIGVEIFFPKRKGYLPQESKSFGWN